MVLRYFIRRVALYHQEENIHLLNVTIGNVVVIIIIQMLTSFVKTGLY